MILTYRASEIKTRQAERVCLGQQCIEREVDALTPAQLKEHAAEVDAACLSELKKWTSLGALKIREWLGSPNVMDSWTVDG